MADSLTPINIQAICIAPPEVRKEHIAHALSLNHIELGHPYPERQQPLVLVGRPSMLGDIGASMDRMSGTYQDDIMRGGTGVKADTTRGPGIFTDKNL